LTRAAALALGACFFVGAAVADDGDDDNGEGHGQPARCAALAGQTIAGARINAADLVAATATAPAYCRVRGLVAPKLNFELRLPKRWNRKLHYGGGGGYNGAIPPATLPALRQGYAQVSSDSGHQGSALDASFVFNDPQAAQLFGSLSVPTVTAVAQEVSRSAIRPCLTASFRARRLTTGSASWAPSTAPPNSWQHPVAPSTRPR
jgi:hypothetical protein